MADETTTSTEPMPDSVDIHGAVALMDKFMDAEEGEGAPADGTTATAEPANAGNAAEEGADIGDGADGTAAESGEGEEGAEAADPSLNEAPEFWSAEDKAAWATIPPALRPMLKKIEAERIQYVKSKEQEAAKVRQEAMESATQATAVVDEAAKWWQANGPQFFKSFGDKWAGVDWNKLAEENPAEWARMRQQRDAEADMLRQAHERGQRDIEAANQRAQARLQEIKRAEHERVAKELPEHFGTPERATKTYEALGQYLLGQGVPAERINAIHEATIIKLGLKAMLYDQAKKQVSTVAKPGAANPPAARTPLRVPPGPANTAANHGSERVRQARERVRSGRSIDDPVAAAALMNSLGL